MFAWANCQLERLSETLAPPSNDPGHRFTKAVRDGDEGEAMRILTSELDPNEKLNQTKGSLAVHIAAQHGAQQVLRQLLCPQYAQAFDTQGNTPLHYASLGGHRSTCQMLIDEFQVSLSVKNSHGKTPYDLATLDSVRQYLLPLQLQRETQECLDNGGIGLIPGVDLGTNRISNLPPPPIHAKANANANLPPPAVQPSSAAPMPNYAPPFSHHTHSAPPSQPHVPAGPAPTHNLSSAPSSSSYARSGFSSAVVSNSKYRPDGFHSSSSDKNLQLKYGHDRTVNGPPSGNISSQPVLPPPIVAPAVSRGASFGAKSRYPTYDAHSNTTATFPVSAPTSANPHAPPMPNFQIFSPVSANRHHQPQYTKYQSYQHNDNDQEQYHQTNDFTSTAQYEYQQSLTYSSHQNHSPAISQQQSKVTESHLGTTDGAVAQTVYANSPSPSKLSHTTAVVSPSKPKEDAGAFFAASFPNNSENIPAATPSMNITPQQYFNTIGHFESSQPPLSEKSDKKASEFFTNPKPNDLNDSKLNTDFKPSSPMQKSVVSSTETSQGNPGPNIKSVAQQIIKENVNSTSYVASNLQTSGTEANDFFVAISSTPKGRSESLSNTQSATTVSSMNRKTSSNVETTLNHEKSGGTAEQFDVSSRQTKTDGLNHSGSTQQPSTSDNDTFGLPPSPAFPNVSEDSTEYSDIDLNMAPLPPPPMMDVPLTQ